MPVISQKNQPLSPAGADLGLGRSNASYEGETDEERKKRLKAIAMNQAQSPASMALLGNGAGGM